MGYEKTFGNMVFLEIKKYLSFPEVRPLNTLLTILEFRIVSESCSNSTAESESLTWKALSCRAEESFGRLAGSNKWNISPLSWKSNLAPHGIRVRDLNADFDLSPLSLSWLFNSIDDSELRLVCAVSLSSIHLIANKL